MAAFALLIGTKKGKREIVADGSPVEIRKLFKSATPGDGYELIEVLESTVGRTRRRAFPKLADPSPSPTPSPAPAKKQAKQKD